MIAYLESKTRQLLANSFILKRYKGMKKIFIGIDFSKEKFDATLIKAEGLNAQRGRFHCVPELQTDEDGRGLQPGALCPRCLQ